MIKKPKIMQEWWREPISNLEKTLRWPVFIKEFSKIIFFRIIIKLVFIGIIFGFIFNVSDYLIIKLIVLTIVSFILVIIWEMMILLNWWKDEVLPMHLKNIESIKTFRKMANQKKANEIVKDIEKSMSLSMKGMAKAGYMAMPSFGFEMVIKLIYPLITKRKEGRYSNLFVGFGNKSIEADQELWKIANIKDKENEKSAIRKYLDDYGSRVKDMDLKHKTLREKPKAIQSLLKIYEGIKSPYSRISEVKNIRIEEERHVRKPFMWLVKKAQENVKIREDRRFYEFLSDYDLRQMIFILAKKLNIKEEDIFNLKWDRIKEQAMEQS